jgi:hypothetical protein
MWFHPQNFRSDFKVTGNVPFNSTVFYEDFLSSNVTERPEMSLPITCTFSQMNSPPDMNATEQICSGFSGEPVAPASGNYSTPEDKGASPVASTSSHHMLTPEHIHPFPKARERKMKEKDGDGRHKYSQIFTDIHRYPCESRKPKPRRKITRKNNPLRQKFFNQSVMKIVQS